MQQASKYSSILLIESGNVPLNNINYFDDLGNRKNIVDNIVRIRSEGEDEWVVLEKGLEIPVEHIHSVDGEISPYYSDDFYKCDCV